MSATSLPPSGRRSFLGRLGLVAALASAAAATKAVAQTARQRFEPRIHDEDAVRHLKLMGDLGMINAVPFHARDRASIAAAVEKSDVVINLLGT